MATRAPESGAQEKPVEQAGQAEQAEQVGQTEQAGQTEQVGQTEQTEQTQQAGQTEQGGQSVFPNDTIAQEGPSMGVSSLVHISLLKANSTFRNIAPQIGPRHLAKNPAANSRNSAVLNVTLQSPPTTRTLLQSSCSSSPAEQVLNPPTTSFKPTSMPLKDMWSSCPINLTATWRPTAST